MSKRKIYMIDKLLQEAWLRLYEANHEDTALEDALSSVENAISAMSRYHDAMERT